MNFRFSLFFIFFSIISFINISYSEEFICLAIEGVLSESDNAVNPICDFQENYFEKFGGIDWIEVPVEHVNLDWFCEATPLSGTVLVQDCIDRLSKSIENKDVIVEKYKIKSGYNFVRARRTDCTSLKFRFAGSSALLDVDMAHETALSKGYIFHDAIYFNAQYYWIIWSQSSGVIGDSYSNPYVRMLTVRDMKRNRLCDIGIN